MRLCHKCNNYSIIGDSVQCLSGLWISVDIQKTKTYNPIMFECLDYQSDEISSSFGNDTFFDVMSVMMK